MTSDISDEFESLKLNDDPMRIAQNSNSNHNYETNQSQRHILHSKRAATLDHENHEEKIRIVILGATKVGKTCLCQQLLQERFVTDHKETVDDMYTAEVALVDRRITLEILDTAGIDEFPVMRRLAIARGDAFLIVYAVDDASSLDIALQMCQLVLEIKGEVKGSSIPLVAVANKCDLDKSLHKITREYALSKLREKGRTTLVETTCIDRSSVLNAFHFLLRMANINMTLNFDVTRRSSDPNLSANKEHRATNKRQSCAQQ